MINAWLDGSMTTAELDEQMTDSEYLRWLHSDYLLELVDRYHPGYDSAGRLK